jgi:hypothetical protein
MLLLLLANLLVCSLSFASSRSSCSSSSSRCPVKLVELALDTSQAWPLDSRADEEIEAPARRSQSESFLSFADSVRFRSSPFRDLLLCRGCGRFDIRCVLDLDFASARSFGFRKETRDDVRDKIEGVVGADRPSMYETWWFDSGKASSSERGSRDVKGARVK